MKNIKIVDARNLSCPQPVVLARKAILDHEQVMVVVDNDAALENVKRMGTKLGCEVRSENKSDGTYEIYLTRQQVQAPVNDEYVPSCGSSPLPSGPFVIVISADKMGKGNDELGYVLIKAFFHTVAEQAAKPDVIIFYNTGVKLTVQGSEVLEDLGQLESDGTEILVCGTCLNYFEIKDKLAVGNVSNMYDIVETMSKSGRLISP